MTPRLRPEKPNWHDQLVATVAATLRAQNWSVEEEPQLAGNLQPDIIAKNPTGKPFVFEVKADPSEAHLGAVAQVEAYRNSLAAEQGDEQAAGVLVVATNAPVELETVAEHAGVELMHSETDSAEALQELLTTRLAGLT
jgi:predicted RecB family endonuclease